MLENCLRVDLSTCLMRLARRGENVRVRALERVQRMYNASCRSERGAPSPRAFHYELGADSHRHTHVRLVKAITIYSHCVFRFRSRFVSIVISAPLSFRCVGVRAYLFGVFLP